VGVEVGIYPALVGYLNAFLVLGIIVAVMYVFARFAAREKEKMEPRAEEVPKAEEGVSKRVEEEISAEEIAAAVAAVVHHVSAMRRQRIGIEVPRHLYSAWFTSWLTEITQPFDYNPYLAAKRREQ